jgi:hypothetical protein
MGIAALHPSYGSKHPSRPAASSLQFVLLPLLAFAKALRDRRSPEDQRSLVGEALREVGVIVLHDVEHGFLGKPSMVIGKEFVQVSELFVVHGFRASAAFPQIYCKLLIPRQLSTRLVTLGGANSDGHYGPAAPQSAARGSRVNHLLTMPA